MPGPSNKSAKGLLVPGTIINLYNRPVTKNMDGTHSTTYSKSFNFDGREVLLPTVVNGKFLTDQQVIQRYKATGEHLGVFDTPANADSYATSLHNSQEANGNFYGARSRLDPSKPKSKPMTANEIAAGLLKGKK